MCEVIRSTFFLRLHGRWVGDLPHGSSVSEIIRLARCLGILWGRHARPVENLCALLWYCMTTCCHSRKTWKCRKHVPRYGLLLAVEQEGDVAVRRERCYPRTGSLRSLCPVSSKILRFPPPYKPALGSYLGPWHQAHPWQKAGSWQETTTWNGSNYRMQRGVAHVHPRGSTTFLGPRILSAIVGMSKNTTVARPGR